MVTSVFFNNYQNAHEQDLYESLLIESIRIYGHDVWYLPRTLNNFDPIYTEDTISSYDKAIQVEMYIKSVDGFAGDGVFLSKFDLEIRDQVTFTIARKVYEFDVAKLTGNGVPKEGDIIYFPLNKKPFQIKFVDHKPFFYQLGELQTYDLVCELFEYSGEDFNTGIEEIDEIQTKYSLDVFDWALLAEDGRVLMTEDEGVILLEFFDIKTQAPHADNDDIQNEQEEDDIFDWTEIEPFSKDGEY